LLPSLNSGLSSSKKNPLNLSSDNTFQASLNASANIVLFNGFANINTIHEMKSAQEVSTYNDLRRRQTILKDVFSKYIEAYLDSTIILLNEENLLSQKQLLVQIEAFAAAGQRSTGDVLSQKTTTAQAELSLVNARNDYEIAKLLLLYLIGEDSLDKNIHLTCPFPDPDTTPPSIEIDFDSLETMGLTKRSDVFAQEANVKISEFQVKKSKAAFSPTLSASAGANTSLVNSSELFDNNKLSSSIGLSLSIPIFNKFSMINSLTKARIKSEQSRSDLQDTKRQASLEIRQAVLNYQAAQERVRVTAVVLESSEQAFNATQARYGVGASTYTDLVQAQAQFNGARSDHVRAIFNVAQATVNVAYAYGDIDQILTYYTSNNNLTGNDK
jgi:outer membrane protein